jgi:hypothetical protein
MYDRLRLNDLKGFGAPLPSGQDCCFHDFKVIALYEMSKYSNAGGAGPKHYRQTYKALSPPATFMLFANQHIAQKAAATLISPEELGSNRSISGRVND